MTDNILGGVAIFICFYQAYRLGNDEKVLVRYKKALQRLIKEHEAVQSQVADLQAKLDSLLPQEETTEAEPENSAEEAPQADVATALPPSLQSLKGDTLNHG